MCMSLNCIYVMYCDNIVVLIMKRGGHKMSKKYEIIYEIEQEIIDFYKKEKIYLNIFV